MTALTAALILTCAQQTPAQAPAAVESPAALIGKMFAKYASADTLLGQIRLTQSVGQVSVVVTTDFQMEKPAKLYIRQQRGGSDPKMWLVTSNGVLFSYNRPEGIGGPDRFVENVHVQDKVPGLDVQRDIRLTNQDIYVAARKSLGDRNAAMDIAIGRTDDLRALASQWVKFANYGKFKVNDVETNKIMGGFAGFIGQPPSGTFELYITDDGELIRYVVREKQTFPDLSKETYEVVSIWDSKLLINAKVNPAFFEVVPASKQKG
jgi:hypothetical protein